MQPRDDVYRFGDARLDISNLKLAVHGEDRPLEPKPLRLLQFLIENRDRVAHKEEILTVVWGGVAVSDNALTRAIAQVRKALDDDPKEPRYIETVPTVGYRFIASLTAEQAPKLEPPPERARRPNPKWLVAAALVVVTLGCITAWTRIASAPPRVGGMRQVSWSAAADLWPSLSPDASQVVFSSNRTGRFELYSKSLAPGGVEHQLTSDGLENIQPAWSPDGQSIAYAATQKSEIRIIPAGGGPPRTVTLGGDSPRWSPDGRSLVFRLDRAAIGRLDENINPRAGSPHTSAYSSAVLAMVDVNGGQVVTLTDPNSGIVRPENPRWLADGRRVGFTSQPVVRSSSRRYSAVSILNANGTRGSRRIQTFEAGIWPLYPAFAPDGRSYYFSDSVAAAPGIWRVRIGWTGRVSDAQPVIPIAGADARYLDLSADGKHLAFSRQSGESSIWSIALDTEGAPVGEPSPVIQDRNIRNTEPWLSRDGTKLIWTAMQPDGWQTICLANADGSAGAPFHPAGQNIRIAQWVGTEQKLAFPARKDGQLGYWISALDGSPERVYPGLDLNRTERIHLSRDGTMLTGHINTPRGQQVVVSALTGGPVRTLTPPTRDIGYPFWSPDGRWIAAQERVNGRVTLVVFPAAGGEIRTVASALDAYFASDWSPDGQRIAFAGLKDGTWNLYWISIATGKVEQLTHSTAGSGAGFVRYPSWSSDGKRIVYERNDWKSNIYLADLDVR